MLPSLNSSSLQSPAPVALCPAAAAQPMRGGIPPTKAPIHVFKTEIRFIGVYTPAYSTIFKPPRKAVVGFTPNHKLPTPNNPATLANIKAPFLPIRPRTSGRFRVLLICASYLGSSNIFRAFAEAQHSAVPEVRKTRVNAESEGDAVVAGSKRAGTGYREYAVAVVRTIRKERRGFERARHVVNNRRRDVAGIVEERVERREDASRGRGASPLASAFKRFRLR